MSIKLTANSAFDGQINESNTASRQYYLPNNDSGIGTTLDTTQATTSGTYKDFLNIPSWVKRITVMFSAVSTSGTSLVQIQLGSGGSFATSGYAQDAWDYTNTTVPNVSSGTSTGFALGSAAATAGDVLSGTVTLITLGSNIWVSTAMCRTGIPRLRGHAGVKTTSGVLDSVRITTVNGTDTFDAGSINIMYE